MIFITDQNAFYLRVTAQTKAGSQMADVDLSVIKWLVAQFVRRGRSLQSMEIDSQGRAVIYNSGDLAMGVYGVEFNGYYNGQPWRFFEKKVFAIVDQTANAVEPSGEISGVPVYDCTITIKLGEEGVPESYVTNAINEHDNDMNAHPYLQELIENAGKVDDVKVNGLSVVDENKEANINITATIDGNVGEPGVDVEQEDGEIRFAFRNMKGDKGETGTQGPQGDSFQPIEDVSGLVLAHTLGEDNTKAMSQKGVKDALGVGESDVVFDLSQYEEVDASISSQGTWILANKGIFVPVVGGKKYQIVANAVNFSTYAFFTSNVVGEDGSPITTFAGNASSVTVLDRGEEAVEVAPVNAAYLYVGINAGGNDRTPQLLKELNKTLATDILGNTESTPTENSNNLVKSGGVYQMIKDCTEEVVSSEIDLSQYTAVRAVIGGNDKWVTNNASYPYYGKIIPIKSMRQYKITGNELRTVYYALLITNTYSNNATVNYAYQCSREVIDPNNYAIITAPENAKYLWISDMYERDRSPQKIEEYSNTQVTSAITAYEGMPKEVNLNSITAYHFGPSGNGKWSQETWYGKFVALNGERKVILKGGTAGTYFCFLKSEGYVMDGNVNYATGYSGNGRGLRAGDYLVVDVPSDAKCLYFFTSFDNTVTSCGPERVVLVSELVGRDEFELSQKNVMPSFIEIGEDTGVLYTTENFIMKYYTEDETGYFMFSTDLGETWVTVENTFDERITHVHYFLDGTFLMFTPSTCYWTKDFETWTESTIYDYDGSIFQPVEGETRFCCMKGRYRTIIDDKEWHVFGDYVLTTTKPRLWYTNDNGRTIRCCFAFGLSNINGTVYNARHVHSFEYNPYDNHFYVFTGDAANECHIMKGICENGVWTWEHIVTGAVWKLVYPEYFPGYFCAITDYTDASLAEKKGVVKVPTQDISEDNITYLFKATSQIMGSSALTNYTCDKNGWRIILTDYLGDNRIMIAKNNFKFRWVANTQGLRIGSFIGPNSNGDIYSSYRPVGASVATEDVLTIIFPKFNFTEAMRKAGATNFCNYKTTDF